MIIKSQPVDAKSDILDKIVDKLYNLIFGYLDSLFDDANYKKEEKTIPKSQAKPGKDYVDAKGQKFNPEDYADEDTPSEHTSEVEVARDGKAIRFYHHRRGNGERSEPRRNGRTKAEEGEESQYWPFVVVQDRGHDRDQNKKNN